jgi:hypothetical protein
LVGHAGGNVDVEKLDRLEEVVELDASLLDRLGRSGEADLDLLAGAGGGGGNRCPAAAASMTASMGGRVAAARTVG